MPGGARGLQRSSISIRTGRAEEQRTAAARLDGEFWRCSGRECLGATECLGRRGKRLEKKVRSEMDKESMTRRSTVEHLVKTYELSEKNIREGCRLIAASEKALSEVFLIGDTTRGIDFREECHRSRLNYDDPTEGIEYLRKQIWHVCVDKLEVRRMMSIHKAKELSDWLEKQSGKEDITVPSVLGFFRYYVENLETMLEEQVSEVFDI